MIVIIHLADRTLNAPSQIGARRGFRHPNLCAAKSADRDAALDVRIRQVTNAAAHQHRSFPHDAHLRMTVSRVNSASRRAFSVLAAAIRLFFRATYRLPIATTIFISDIAIQMSA
jgi:hypothetical protein